MDSTHNKATKGYIVAYGPWPDIITCDVCSNLYAEGMLCGFCNREGQAPCPASAPHTQCVLCRGVGYVEELKP